MSGQPGETYTYEPGPLPPDHRLPGAEDRPPDYPDKKALRRAVKGARGRFTVNTPRGRRLLFFGVGAACCRHFFEWLEPFQGYNYEENRTLDTP